MARGCGFDEGNPASAQWSNVSDTIHRAQGSTPFHPPANRRWHFGLLEATGPGSARNGSKRALVCTTNQGALEYFFSEGAN